MRVYVSVDIEGITGVVHRDMMMPGEHEYNRGRRLMMGDANAAIEGLVKAGATDVVEVHGNVMSAKCERCGERYGLPEVGQLIADAVDGVPRCTTPGCGYPLRPSGTLWNEPLLEEGVQRAWDLAGQADAFLVFDSALRTIPISLLPSVPLTRNVPLGIVGRTATQYDRYARVVIREPAEPVLVALADMLCPEEPGT